MSGSVNFSPPNNPPQSYMFCGRCDDHFLVCSCEGVEYGSDYIFKNLPPPPPNLTPLERLRRFSDLVSVSPTMKVFAAHMWHQNEAPALIDALNETQTQNQLTRMVDEYIEMIRTQPEDLSLTQMAKIVGGPPLEEKSASVQIEMIAREARAAIASFIACDWPTVTKAGILLIHNAYQVSDPQKYPIDDPNLSTIYSKGVDCLKAILDMGYSNTHFGWRLAMEPDRQPQGTNSPIQSATRRDYFLRYYNSTHCQFCGKEGDALRICSACRSVKYCNVECQKKHRKFHKQVCRQTEEELRTTGTGGLELD
ncbi:hypothetical protein QTG54_006678 [Skeletonema marinoi]|uniref:MYND-type domain-containing protein n=1 Tax=Skeletonema marinoi TaxID=267567 RepID=A0AAD9DCZ7_9STRA|nr:hypothetical protein QTG54_006678 [Skeletonema marinoi]